MSLDLRCERLALVGLFERFRHRAIEVLDECQDFRFQIVHAGEIASFEQFPHQDAEPDFHLVHPGGMLWRVVKNDPMGGDSQEGRPRFHRLQNTAFAFETQIDGEIRFFSHVAHQGFRLMSIEVIDHEVPLDDLWGAFHAALDMLYEIGFVARSATGNRGDLTGSHFKVDDEG